MQSKPYGAMDPNSQHQMWSRWVFRVFGKPVPLAEVTSNAVKWLKQGFGTVGRARVSDKIETVHDPVARLARIVEIECEVEGRPAHDPDYIASVKKSFDKFVEQGWGVTAYSEMSVKVLAGDKQDGKPREQMVVMPHIPLVN